MQTVGQTVQRTPLAALQCPSERSSATTGKISQYPKSGRGGLPPLASWTALTLQEVGGEVNMGQYKDNASNQRQGWQWDERPSI